MSGDYKIEIFGYSGHHFISEDSWESQRDARAEIRQKQASGAWDRCDFYIVNRRTGWRSSKVEPKPKRESHG